MKTIKITDSTMIQANDSGKYPLTFREKLDLSKMLDNTGVSVIEIEGITTKKADTLRIKSIASIIKNSILSVPVSLFLSDEDLIWDSLADAPGKRLKVHSPVSTVQMEYIHHQKPEAIVLAVSEKIKKCRQLSSEVEFEALDATRSEMNFLTKIIQMAIESGATTITLCDTAGIMLPDEITSFIENIYESVPDLNKVSLGFSCSDKLSLAEACAVSAIKAGAQEIKVSALNTDGVSLKNLATLLHLREDVFKIKTGINNARLGYNIDQIETLCSSKKSKNSPFENGVKDDTFSLSSDDDKATVLNAIDSLGYTLLDEDFEKVWAAFYEMASQKKTIGSRELEAIIASYAMQVPSTYKLDSYLINTGSDLGSTAHMKLSINDRSFVGLSMGDGPIDAAYLAIEKITGHHYELDDFQIRSVTEGREAVGETITKLRHNGKIYSGRGISTDITNSAIKAYLNALNKIVYEEGTE